MDNYSVSVRQTDVLAARQLLETNNSRGICSPVFLIKLAETVLPTDQIEGQETLW